MKISLAQLNPIIGDLNGNASKIIEACDHSSHENPDLLITPELSLWGYPPKDLLLNLDYIKEQEDVLKKISMYIKNKMPNLSVLIGVAETIDDSHIPNLFNSIAMIQNGTYKIIARKQLLPTYDIFDEKRYFRSARETSIIKLKNESKIWKLGITICEDIWVEENLQRHRTIGPDPIAQLVQKNIDLLINISASPFSQDKESLRYKIISKASNRLNCPSIYLNQVGGNDELVFDGSSFVVNKKGEIELSLPRCREAICFWDTANSSSKRKYSFTLTHPQEQIFESLVLGVKDYAIKCGFTSALIGLSGGIDSAIVTTIAVAALGDENVSAILMPSPWSSQGSIDDALSLANRLNIQTKIISIKKLMESFDTVLTKPLNESPRGVTAENLQSRIRGTLLMALANQHNHLLLSTGNKSELAVGYCTLYGDMNGGLSVIGDLYKTDVFNLSEWIDSEESSACRQSMRIKSTGEVIGSSIRTKAPSAELRPNQLDTDSLPDYFILDPILKDLIEGKVSKKELIKSGQDPNLIKHVEKLVKQAEFKRRQAPPLLKISNQAFGSGWRKPIATI